MGTNFQGRSEGGPGAAVPFTSRQVKFGLYSKLWVNTLLELMNDNTHNNNKPRSFCRQNLYPPSRRRYDVLATANKFQCILKRI